MKTLIAGIALATTLSLGLTACFAPEQPTTAQPADGPANTQTQEPQSVPEATTEASEDTGQDTSVASFEEKFVYGDGVEVEVTKIQHGKVNREDAEYTDYKVGTAYVILSLRVRNKSRKVVEVYQDATLTYGPDGEEAEAPYSLSSRDDQISVMNGKILPGRAKTGVTAFFVPEKHQGEVALELNWDMNFSHDAAIFAGSVVR